MKQMTARLMALMISTTLLGACMSTTAIGAGDSWKEEVLLHDGQKMMVERSQTYGGRSEPGQPPPAREVTIRFKPPGAANSITWTSEYGDELGRTNFNLLALHIKQGTPYLVTEPNLCLSYNKWGRPNPPYVVFKHDAGTWQRIAVSELPAEFKTINMIVNNSRLYEIAESSKSAGYVTADAVMKINSTLRQPEYKTILREAYAGATNGCSEMIRTSDGWEGLGFFRLQKSHEACLQYCTRKGVNQSSCPCESIFKGVK